MNKWEYSSLGFVLFLLVSMVTHLAELGFTAYVCYWLYDTGQTVWMALVTGLLIVPLLAVQLTSFALHNLRLAERNRSGCDVGVVVWHVLQMGLVWRYCRLAYSRRVVSSTNSTSSSGSSSSSTSTGSSSSSTSRELWEVFLLRCSYVFFSTLLILSMETYLSVTLPFSSSTVHTARSLWPVFTAMGVSLTSAAWVLATFRRTQNACCVVGALSWSGLVAKLIWRLGELTGRVLLLCLFARCHSWWLFLVLAFHVCTMAALNVLENVLHGTDIKPWWDLLLKPYVSLFCYFSAGLRKSKYGFALYYTVTSLEGVTLLILWLLYDEEKHLHLALTLVVIICYLTGLVAAVVYYNCYHRTKPESSNAGTSCVHQCSNCRVSSCVRHKIQRPYLATWVQVKDNQSPKFTDMLDPAEGDNNVRVRDPHEQGSRRHHGASSSGNTSRGQGLQTSHSHRLAKQILGEDVEFIWDDYDMKELPEYDSGAAIEAAMEDIFEMHGVSVDNGYYSGISSSSNNDTRLGMNQAVHNMPNPGEVEVAPVQSDTSMSMISTVSSRVPMLNCQHCGHAVSLDSSSMYSATTATSYDSRLAPGVGSHRPRSPGFWRHKRRPARRSSMPNRHYTSQHRGGATYDSTADSSAWEPTSDSEV